LATLTLVPTSKVTVEPGTTLVLSYCTFRSRDALR
jgi:hypothetical protein